MLIERENLNAIKKRKILEIEHTKYTLSKYLIACYYLKKIIRNSVIDTFELIELLRKHYSGDILEAFKAITMEEYQEVRFNCYYLSKILKEKLNSFGIKTEYITYKSDGFSIDVGDDIIKESHISIVWPIRKNNEDIFIIFDPGL